MFYVPLGTKKWFTDQGIHKAVELDWWHSTVHHKPGTSQTVDDNNNNTEEGCHITFIPVQHWSARGLGDRFEALWGGFCVEGLKSKHKVVFCGDTGYCPVFAEIGNHISDIDLALIPIGAYEPRWFMKAQHVDPSEAVQMSLDLKAKLSIGMHWGTFVLTDEPILEPRDLLKQELQARNLPDSHFVTLNHGQTVQYTRQ